MRGDWKCHICGVFRPDDKISVRKHAHPVKGMAPTTMGENIRYCNDRMSCIEASRTHCLLGKVEEHI
jgi:hypothetical protein